MHGMKEPKPLRHVVSAEKGTGARMWKYISRKHPGWDESSPGQGDISSSWRAGWWEHGWGEVWVAPTSLLLRGRTVLGGSRLHSPQGENTVTALDPQSSWS